LVARLASANQCVRQYVIVPEFSIWTDRHGFSLPEYAILVQRASLIIVLTDCCGSVACLGTTGTTGLRASGRLYRSTVLTTDLLAQATGQRLEKGGADHRGRHFRHFGR
jgi:hypothetical protein